MHKTVVYLQVAHLSESSKPRWKGDTVDGREMERSSQDEGTVVKNYHFLFEPTKLTVNATKWVYLLDFCGGTMIDYFYMICFKLLRVLKG